MIQPKTDTAELRRLYEDEGLTLQQVGDRIGLTRQAVHIRLSKAGVKMRPHGLPPIRLERDLLYRLYVVEGLTFAQTCAKLGVTGTPVKRELERHGIDR